MLRQNDKIVLFFYEMRKPLEYLLQSAHKSPIARLESEMAASDMVNRLGKQRYNRIARLT